MPWSDFKENAKWRKAVYTFRKYPAHFANVCLLLKLPGAATSREGFSRAVFSEVLIYFCSNFYFWPKLLMQQFLFLVRLNIFLSGVGILTVKPDLMHNKHLGMDQYVFASVLALLVFFVMDGNAKQNFANVWRELKIAYKARNH